MISVPADSKSEIVWKHIDGPMYVSRWGEMHWLTLLERMAFKFGSMTIEDLDKKYGRDPNEPCKG